MAQMPLIKVGEGTETEGRTGGKEKLLLLEDLLELLGSTILDSVAEAVKEVSRRRR